MLTATSDRSPVPPVPTKLPAALPGGAGLTMAEAAARRATFGPNEVESGRRFEAARTLLRFLSSPLVLILLAASIVSGFLGEPLNAALIALMVMLSVVLDFVQVYRSERAAEKLQRLVALTATVWRDGQQTEIAVRDVVPGDLLDLHAGDLVVADATLQAAAFLTLDEASLTGESIPVEKRGGGDGPQHRVFAGTSVVSGEARAVVTETGSRTQFGAIAHALVQRAPVTEFESGSRRFGYLIMRTVVGLVLFVFLVNAALKRDALESFLFSLALAVGLTPEFLPMIITVTLGRGAQRMAQGKVIVKRLASIENLGSMDVLCSDKTGTLTLGKVVLEQHVDAGGHDSASVLRWACVNSALETGLRSPLDEAILAHEYPALPAFVKRAELPFDFDRRRVSVLAQGPLEGDDPSDTVVVQVITKGAPEGMLPLCTQVDSEGAPIPFTHDRLQMAQDTFNRLSRTGYHVLAIGRKPVAGDQTTLTAADERDLILCGFAAFLDPPDPSAREMVARLRGRGVTVKILTGDGELVTRTICEQVGVPADRVLLGDDLAKMTDDALVAAAAQTDVFARVSPSQKNRVILALRRGRHVVGYIGDGINDAPSLHAADVGISVSNGVEVARAAADIILLEKNLAAIDRGVVEGRRSFGNIAKYVLMGTSSNFGNMVSMAAASAILPFLPLLPVQILLNNFLYDLAQLTIPTDNVDASYLARPRKWDTGMIQRFMFGLGPISSAYDFLTFAVLLFGFKAAAPLFRAGWFVESLATQILVIFVIRTAGNPFRSRPSVPLLLSVAACLAAGIAIPMSPLGGAIGFTPLPAAFFAVLVVMTATYLVIVESTKRWFFAASNWRES